MSLAWLLFVRSFWYSWGRFVLIVGAIGVSAAILLLLVAGLNGLSNRMGSTSWRQTIVEAATAPQQTNHDTEPLYVTLSFGSSVDSLWRDKQINVTRLAAGDPSSPQFQDLPTPATGEYYVSSGLKKIIDEHPEDSIGSRFGEKLLGLIPDKYVSSPDELSVVSSMDISEAKRLESTGASVLKLYHIDQKPAIDPKYSNIIMPILYIGIFMLLFPTILLVSVATRLGSSQREQRYAALRLVGASRAQVRRVMILESAVASVIGIGIGLAIYIAARPLMLEFGFNGMRFWPHQIAIPTIQVVGILAATLAFTVITNWWGIRRVQMSPLGVMRRTPHRKQPHWWRLIPLLIGGGTVGFVASPFFDTAQDSQKNIAAILIFASVIVLMFGLIIAGPLVTQKLAMLIARYTKHAEVLLGMKHIAFNALSVFRSVSGVVVALFVGSFLLACANGMQSYMAQSVDTNSYSRLLSDTALLGSYVASEPLPNGQESTLQALDYVRSVTEIKQVSYSFAVMSCQTATEYLSIQCPTGNYYVGVSFSPQVSGKDFYGVTENEVYEQIKDTPYANLSAVVPNYLIQINYDDIDKLRSFVAAHYIGGSSVGASLFDGTTSNTPFIHPIIKEAAELAYIGISITMLVAVVSLAISTIGGLLERRRSLTILRLGGMTVGSLKRVVIIESLVPLLSASLASSVLGLAVGFVLMTQLTQDIHSVLSASYLLLFVGCVVVAVAIIMCILPLIKRMTHLDRSTYNSL